MKNAAVWLLCFFAAPAMAAEIKVLSAGAVEPGLRSAAGAYSKQSGNQVNITFNTAPEIRKRVSGGEAFDVVIAPPAALEEFAGKVSADRVPLGRVGVGVVARSGASAPDVSSVDALKRALLGADSVVYNQASTGLYLEKLFDKMGVGDQIKSKTTRYANGAQVLEHVIGGKGNEIGFGAITEIRLYEAKGLKLVGPLPPDVQNYTSYSAAPMAAAAQPELARAFVRFLVSPESKALFAAAGVD